MKVHRIAFAVLFVTFFAFAMGFSGSWALFVDYPSILFCVILGTAGSLALSRHLSWHCFLKNRKVFLYVGILGTLMGLIAGLPHCDDISKMGAVFALASLTTFYGMLITLILKFIAKES